MIRYFIFSFLFSLLTPFLLVLINLVYEKKGLKTLYPYQKLNLKIINLDFLKRIFFFSTAFFFCIFCLIHRFFLQDNHLNLSFLSKLIFSIIMIISFVGIIRYELNIIDYITLINARYKMIENISEEKAIEILFNNIKEIGPIKIAKTIKKNNEYAYIAEGEKDYLFYVFKSEGKVIGIYSLLIDKQIKKQLVDESIKVKEVFERGSTFLEIIITGLKQYTIKEIKNNPLKN